MDSKEFAFDSSANYGVHARILNTFISSYLFKTWPWNRREEWEKESKEERDRETDRPYPVWNVARHMAVLSDVPYLHSSQDGNSIFKKSVVYLLWILPLHNFHDHLPFQFNAVMEKCH